MADQEGRISYSIGLDTDKLRSDAAESKNILRGIGSSAVDEGNRIDATFKKVGVAIGAAFTAAQALSFAKDIIAVRKEIEGLEVSFTTLLGSKEKADALFGQIRTFAVNTPMQLGDLAKGAQTLLSFNYEADKVMTTLKALGDISMGDSARFNSLTLAFAQMSSTGKLMGQDLLQMINAGFNPLSIIAEQTGKSIADLKDEMSNGAISAEMVEKAFIDATQEGGKFYGMLDAQSKTIGGALSNLKGAVDDMFNEIGEKGQGAFTDVVLSLTDMAKHYQEIGEAIAALIAIYGTYKAAVATTAIIDTTGTTIKHTEEAAALNTLLSAEQRESIAKMNLSRNSAEYAAVVKKEALANLEVARTSATRANAQMQSSIKAAASAKAEYLTAVSMETQAKKNLVLAEATGDAKAIEAAKRDVTTAATIREDAATKMLSTQKAAETARTTAGAAAETASALAKNVETASAAGDATAHGILTVAKNAASAAAAKLNAIIMANPYALAAAAVVALAYGIYKLVTYQTDAEKAAERLGDASKNCEAAIASEQVKIDQLFGTLKGATKGTQDYEDAKNAIISQYGDYLKGLGDEITSLRDVEAAYNAVTEAAIKAAKARAMQEFTEEESKNFGETYSDNSQDIRSNLIKKYGNKKGAEYFIRIKPVIEGKKQITDLDKEMQNVVKSFNKTTYIAQGQFAPAIAITSNTLTSSINKITGARKTLTETMNEARHIFGNEGLEEPKKQEAPKPVVKNKKYWEDYLKQLQGQLDAMSDVDAKGKQGKALAKKIQEAQTKVDTYSPKAGVSAAHKSETSRQKAEREAAKEQVQSAGLDEKMSSIYAQQEKEARQHALDLRQAEIDGMQEGFDKELAMNDLNYRKMMEENTKRQEAYIEQIRDIAELEWEQANPKAKEQGKTFDRNSISADVLKQANIDAMEQNDSQAMLQTMRNSLDEYSRIAGESLQRANENTLKTMLGDIQTYEQKIEKLNDEFNRKEEGLYNHTTDANGNTARTGLKQGVTEGNVAELQRQREEAMTALNEEFASKEQGYQAWMDAIGGMTLDNLKIVLQNAKKELEGLEAAGKGGKDLAVAKAKVAMAEKEVAKASAKAKMNPSKRSLKDWKELHDVLQEGVKGFEDIGDAVGGATGEIMKNTGRILSGTLSMINGIMTLTQTSASSMEATSLAGVATMSTIEKASVILAVISAALQIASSIANMFNDDEEKQEEIDKLQDRIDQLQWELDNADVVRLRKNVDSLQLVRDTLKETYTELLKQAQATGNLNQVWRLFFSNVSNNQTLLLESAKKMADVYANIAYTTNKALGSGRYDNSRKDLENIAQQQQLIAQQINDEKGMKETDWGQIQEWENKIEELGNQAVEIINGMVEDIIGGSSNEITKQLSDAFFDAFQNGEDYATAWADKVKELVADIMKRMLVQKFLEEPLGEIFNKYKDKWFKNGTFQGLDTVINSMQGFASDLNAVGSDFAAIWDNLPDSVKNMFTVTSDAEREASDKGIVTASQESVDELNGRATAIQGHTYSISENTKLLVSITNNILQAVMNIDRSTEGMSVRMERMEGNVKEIKDTINDIARLGIKMK